MIKTILFNILCLLVSSLLQAQTPGEIEHSKKLFSATWVNKKEKRYIEFFYDSEVSYVTVNDWTGNSNPAKSKSLDAYKAWIKGSKLILTAENADHHAPYCEIEILNKKLVFSCNGMLNFKEQKLSRKGPIDMTVYERMRN